MMPQRSASPRSRRSRSRSPDRVVLQQPPTVPTFYPPPVSQVPQPAIVVPTAGIPGMPPPILMGPRSRSRSPRCSRSRSPRPAAPIFLPTQLPLRYYSPRHRSYSPEYHRRHRSPSPRHYREGSPRYREGVPPYHREGISPYHREGDPRYHREGSPRYHHEGSPRYRPHRERSPDYHSRSPPTRRRHSRTPSPRRSRSPPRTYYPPTGYVPTTIIPPPHVPSYYTRCSRSPLPHRFPPCIEVVDYPRSPPRRRLGRSPGRSDVLVDIADTQSYLTRLLINQVTHPPARSTLRTSPSFSQTSPQYTPQSPSFIPASPR